jgi:putative addiction module component (TIGR02574 family)
MSRYIIGGQKGGIIMRAVDIPAIDGLSTSEKILLVEDLWDIIAADESSVPVPQSHKQELDRRQKSYESHPGNLLTLEELQGRVERRK